MNAIPAELPEAMKLHAAGRLPEAESFYRKLLAANPDHPEVLHLLAVTRFQQQAFDEAIGYLEQAIRKDKKNPKHYLRLVEIYKTRGAIDATIDTLETLLAAVPEHTKAIEELMNLCLNHKRFDPAIAQLNKLIAKYPEDSTLRSLIILACTEAKRYEQSLPHYAYSFNQTMEQDPGFYKGYGKALHHAGRLREAIEFAEEAIRRFPQDEEMYILQAANHTALAEHDKTIECYQRALTIHPTRPSLHQSIGLMKFLRTGMKDGYDDYLWRHKLEKAAPFHFDLPEWKGERLQGKRLILWSEQGIGDIIMFLSLLPWVLQEGAKVTLACYPKLQPLFRRSFPEIELVDLNTNLLKEKERWDYHSALGELMRYALPHYTPSEHAPFLKADTEKADVLRKRYLEIGKAHGATKLIGISWFTSNSDSSYMRNIPIENWAPLIDVPHIQWISLQYGDCAGDIAAINKKKKGRLYQDPDIDAYEDTDGLAAQIAAMDEVITIQNATAHMAGALGIPTTLLLSAAADWRWGLTRDDSLWYTRVTVCRQKEALQWKPLMQDLRKRLNP